MYVKNLDVLNELDSALPGRFGEEYLPARTTIFVSELLHGADITIDAQAAIVHRL